MKNFYCSLLFLVFSLLVSGQTILRTAETTTRTVQDPYTVILSPGFSAKGTTSNPFIARIGTLTEIPPASPNNSVSGQSNPSGEVISSLNGSIFHDTKGDIAVAAAGQLTFSLPIALPPGINSVAPQMNLSYTSGSGNGIAGYGWSLSGITNIARIGKNIEKDNILKGLDLTYNDIYVFNGNRLLLKSGEYGKNGAEYVTEKFSNLKIKSIGAIAGQTYQGPESWEVTFDDGSQAWYGTNPSSRNALEYNITKWKDAQGNYITYNYAQTENVTSISNIQWGGNENLLKPHFNSIDFEYIARNSKEIAYSNGLAFTQNNLLKNIVVKANNSLFKKYVVDYKNDTNNTKYQYVDNITEYNSQNQAANPVVFNYERSINSNWNSRPFSDNDNDKIIGDFDGDGTIDYLKYYESYTECLAYEDYEVSYDDGEGNSTQTQSRCISSVQRGAGVNLFASYFSNTGQMQSVSEPMLSFTKEQFNNAIAVNFIDNNKQVSTKQGVLMHRLVPIAGSLQKDCLIEIYALDNNGVLRLKTSKTLPAALYDFRDDSDDEIRIITSINDVLEIDLDGNGISEAIILCTKTTSDRTQSSDGRPVEVVVSVENFSIIADLNPEILPASSFTKTNLYHEIKDGKIGDFNGNGKSDILGFYSNGNPYLIEFYKDISSQEYAYNYKYFPSLIVKGKYDKAILGDFNGDRKTDLIVPVANGSKDWNMYISNENDFIEYNYPNFSYYEPNNSFVDAGRAYYYNRQYLAQDLNQDGKSDFIEFSSHSRQNRNTENNFSEFIINSFENKGFDIPTGKYTMEKKNIDGHTEAVTPPAPNAVPNNNKQYQSYPFYVFDSGTTYRSNHAPFASDGTPNKTEPFSIMIGNFNISNTNNQIVVIKKGNYILSITLK